MVVESKNANMKNNSDIRRRKDQKDTKTKSVPRYYPIKVKHKNKKPPPIPEFANWGFTFYHPAIKVLIFSVFLAFVCLTTPFWAYVDDSTFGLWMYCYNSRCTSIHDNLVPNRDVPAWYHLTQGSFCIGTIASLVSLGILVNNVYSKQLKMTKTVYTTAVSVLGISVMQMTVSLYTFVTYFEHTNFLYQVVDFNDQKIDFHGSFYCGLVSVILTAVSAIILLLDDDLTKASKVQQVLMRASRGQVDPRQLQQLYNDYARLGYYDYGNVGGIGQGAGSMPASGVGLVRNEKLRSGGTRNSLGTLNGVSEPTVGLTPAGNENTVEPPPYSLTDPAVSDATSYTPMSEPLYPDVGMPTHSGGYHGNYVPYPDLHGNARYMGDQTGFRGFYPIIEEEFVALPGNKGSTGNHGNKTSEEAKPNISLSHPFYPPQGKQHQA